jgi:hypothetical protein
MMGEGFELRAIYSWDSLGLNPYEVASGQERIGLSRLKQVNLPVKSVPAVCSRTGPGLDKFRVGFFNNHDLDPASPPRTMKFSWLLTMILECQIILRHAPSISYNVPSCKTMFPDVGRCQVT